MTQQELEARLIFNERVLSLILGSALGFVPDGAKRLDDMKKELTTSLEGEPAELRPLLKTTIESFFHKTAEHRAATVRRNGR